MGCDPEKDNAPSQEIPVPQRKSAQKVHRLTSGVAKTSAVYWASKVKKPSGSSLYGVQIAYKGTRHRFPLETANKEAAAEKARNIYLSLVGKGWEATLQELKPQAIKVAKPATIGTWLEAVKCTSELRPSTFTNYAQCLRQIAAEIEDVGDQPVLDENGVPKRDRKRRIVLSSRFDYKRGGREAWISKVDDLPLTVLSPNAVQRWKVDYIARAGNAPDARRRAENSAATLIRCARSLFSPKHRKFVGEELILPDPVPFEGVDLPKKGSTSYQSKIDSAKLIEAATRELSGEPFKIFVLGLFCGMRKREIDLLMWSQVDFEKALIRIERTEYFSPKSEDSVGEIDLEDETLALLRAWKAQSTGDFVVDSNREPRHHVSRANYRCAPHFETLYKWLKNQGVTARKPLHELRKELGAILASNHGIFAAQSVLRHAQISTTASYYTDKKKRITAGLGGLLATPRDNVVPANFGEETRAGAKLEKKSV